MTNPRVCGPLLFVLAACGHNEAPPTSPPSAPAGVEATSGTTAAAAPATAASPATEILAKNRAPFDACYAKARANRPDLPATSVEITFALDDAGKPMTVDLQYRHKFDEGAKECLRSAALALTFPASVHGKQTGTITFAPSR